MFLHSKKFWLLVLVVLAALPLIGLKLLNLKAKKPERAANPSTLEPCPGSPNCVCSEEGTQPEKAAAPFEATLPEAKAAIIATGGTITSETDSYVSATYMSKIYKFVDDVELRADGAGKTQIRSCSRVGYSDRGMNKKRVAAIRAALKSV